MIFLDTDVLISAQQPGAQQHKKVSQRLAQLVADGEQLVVCPQVMFEFYEQATESKDKGGLGLSPQDAQKEVDRLRREYLFLPETRQGFLNWDGLARQHKVKGAHIRITRMIAFMQTYRIHEAFTLNTEAFHQIEKGLEMVKL